LNWPDQPACALILSPLRSPAVTSASEFDGKFRDECLNDNGFVNVGDARRRIGEYWREYNEDRGHSSLGRLTLAQYRAQLDALMASEISSGLA
jgi:putative transposase